MRGTRIRNTLEGRCVYTIELIRPMRRASGAAASIENAPAIPVQKNIVPAVTMERWKRWKNHNATSDCPANPPANVSSEKTAASVYTTRFDLLSGAVGAF